MDQKIDKIYFVWSIKLKVNKRKIDKNIIILSNILQQHRI